MNQYERLLRLDSFLNNPKYGITEIIPDDIKEIKVSVRNNKKYVVVMNNNKKIHFGDKKYGQYLDRIGEFKYLDHNDETRRDGYLSRASKIRNKYGLFTVNDPMSPNYWSVRLLWN